MKGTAHASEVCARCGRRISLNANGRFRIHLYQLNRRGTPPAAGRCDASGFTPEQARAIDQCDFVAPGQVPGQRQLYPSVKLAGDP